ncbi:diguanylate cyclase [Geotalea daltonii FRC-32]|uniref:diguanylate cyclase n=1 Tax=Geotalea daltonii (strain DSM 22248 / JCM 15807 / FRC-32) TaxID=316067 RepID=B9M5L0_GEODF|nr:GGDEF domain-containing protein [Geotalea daltonii]ACM21769.1 diguanylate cyclase [Geotalea daltonii FRC-32]
MYDAVHNRVFEYLEKRSKISLLFSGYILVAILAYVDYVTGDFSIILFYLIPIFLVGWFVNKRSVFFICLYAALASLCNQFLTHPATTTFHHSWDFIIESSYMILLGLMFSTLREKHDQEKQLARIDPLTRVLNRRYLYEMAEQEINRSRRYDRFFSIAYLDLDNFKAINDTKGHHVGDDLLCVVAGTIVENMRCADMVARIGGDEFVVLMPETGASDARSALVKLQERLMERMGARNWPVSFSVGLVTYYCPPTSVDEMLKKADGLMYEVKSQEKNSFRHEVVETSMLREHPSPPRPVRMHSGKSLLSGGFTITILTDLKNKIDTAKKDRTIQ